MDIFTPQSRKTYFENRAQSAIVLNQYGVVRKYINEAVYVESPANTSDTCLLENSFTRKKRDYSLKRVKCSCSTSPSSCNIHKSFEGSIPPKQLLANQIICKPSPSAVLRKGPSDLKLELQEREEFKSWIIKKNEEKKRILEREVEIKEKEENLKQKQLDQERENFRRWLAHKKRETEKKKLEKEKQIKDRKGKDAEKAQRLKESELHYQLWLKRKEQLDLEKKIDEQMKIIKIADHKQRRLEDNERAFQSWLHSSKDKPKPLPLGRGLDSLRSSLSVAYINPIPWIPNTEQVQKPSSQ